MVSQTHELRGLPLWLLKEYLCEIGGHEVDGNGVEGTSWRASLTQMEDFQVGAIYVGQVRLDLEIDEDILGEFTVALEKKLLRAGG